MLEAIDPFRRALAGSVELNRRLFENCFRNIDDQTARKRIGRQTNNMAFIGCHLVDARHFLARLLGEEVGSSFGGRLDNIEGIEEAMKLPTVEEILEAWAEIGSVLERRISSITTEKLEARIAQEFPIADRTLRGAVLFLLGHESFHLGQLSLLRKHLGFAAMSWGVESPEN